MERTVHDCAEQNAKINLSGKRYISIEFRHFDRRFSLPVSRLGQSYAPNPDNINLFQENLLTSELKNGDIYSPPIRRI